MGRTKWTLIIIALIAVAVRLIEIEQPSERVAPSATLVEETRGFTIYELGPAT